MGTNRLAKPKWQLYDIQNNPEHQLFEDYITEFTDISGIVCNYYIRDNSIELDYLYGETTRTRYLGPYTTKLLYEPTEEPTLTTGYGINSEEVISFASIPKLMFTRDVSAGYHPVPGDCLVTPWNNRAYEIADVAEEEKIFQLKKMIWGFVLRPYRFSEQSDSAKDIARFNRDPSPELDTDTLSDTLSAYGDNGPTRESGDINTVPTEPDGDNIESDSDEIFDYDDDSDIDSSIYGY